MANRHEDLLKTSVSNMHCKLFLRKLISGGLNSRGVEKLSNTIQRGDGNQALMSN